MKKICLILTTLLLLGVICFADLRETLLLGDENGKNLDKPLLRGQGVTLFQRYDNIQVDRLKAYVDDSERAVSSVNAKIDSLGYTTTKVLNENRETAEVLRNRIDDLVNQLQKTRDQLAFISKAFRSEIKQNAEANGSQLEWESPFWFRSEILNSSSGSGVQTLSIGYDFKLIDPSWIATVAPAALYQSGGLLLGVRGEIRWGHRN